MKNIASKPTQNKSVIIFCLCTLQGTVVYFVQEIVLVVYTCTSGFYTHVHQGFIHMYMYIH